MLKSEMGPREPEESQENLNQNDESQKVNRRGFLKAIAGAAISSEFLGKGAEVLAGDKSEKEIEEIKKDREFLGERFEDISGGGIVRKDGNLIVHVGNGSYYEIIKTDSQKLWQIKETREYRKIDADHKEMIKNAEKMIINTGDKIWLKRLKDFEEMQAIRRKTFNNILSQRIRGIGQKLSINELPENLKEFEEERIKKEELKK